jgi:hypothetical protein
VPSQDKTGDYVVASSDDLLNLFDADCGLLSISNETKVLGKLENSQEALAMLEYLRIRKFPRVRTSHDLADDFPDLKYKPGFSSIAGLLLVPLSSGGQDFIVFFRKPQISVGFSVPRVNTHRVLTITARPLGRKPIRQEAEGGNRRTSRASSKPSAFLLKTIH